MNCDNKKRKMSYTQYVAVCWAVLAFVVCSFGLLMRSGRKDRELKWRRYEVCVTMCAPSAVAKFNDQMRVCVCSDSRRFVGITDPEPEPTA